MISSQLSSSKHFAKHRHAKMWGFLKFSLSASFTAVMWYPYIVTQIINATWHQSSLPVASSHLFHLVFYLSSWLLLTKTSVLG